MTISRFALSFVASALWLAALPAGAESHAAASPASAASLKLMPGEYVRASYLAELRRSRSPYASLQKGPGGLMTVRLDNKQQKTSFAFNWNFHEGDESRIFSADGKSIAYAAGKDERPVAIAIESPDAFTLSGTKEVSGRFERVSSFSAIVNSQTVAGTYKDKQGNKYIFRPSGNASFPHEDFRYFIGTDHVGAPYDWLKIGLEIWGYKATASELQLFHFTKDSPERYESQAFLILSRIAD